MDSLALLSTKERLLALDIQSLTNRLVRLDISEPNQILAFIGAQSSLVDQISAREFEDELLVTIRDRAIQGGDGQSTVDSNEFLDLSADCVFPEWGIQFN